MINFHPLEVVGRGSETQLQVGENLGQLTLQDKASQCVQKTTSGFGSRSRRFERDKNVSSPSTCESQYCGEHP